jgi:hypothetical protein
VNFNSFIVGEREDRTHHSLILYKNKIISHGTEDRAKTHPLAKEMGYPYPTIHSEFDAYRQLTKKQKSLRGMTLMNFRISPTKKLGMSKPCKYCMPWVCELFDEVWYTNDKGVLVKL